MMAEELLIKISKQKSNFSTPFLFGCVFTITTNRVKTFGVKVFVGFIASTAIKHLMHTHAHTTTIYIHMYIYIFVCTFL